MNGLDQAQVEQLLALDEWIKSRLAKGPIAVIAGQNGDMDTVGSAIALSTIHPHLMACGLHLGRVSKRLVEQLQAPFRKLAAGHTNWPVNISGFIIVDAAAEGQTGLELGDVDKCVIDHHATNDWEFGQNDLHLKWDVRATTQIISDYLLNSHQQCLTSEVRKLLLAGLITDTARFRHADSGSFRCAVNLLEGSEIDYAEFLQFIENDETSPSERGSLLRGLNRAVSIDAGEWNLIQTHSGTLEGRLAGLLLGIGGEVSLVSRHRDGTTRLTARANRKTTQAGVHLGHIMQAVANQIGGEGGGHAGAAGWTGSSDRIKAETAFISHLSQSERKEVE